MDEQFLKRAKKIIEHHLSDSGFSVEQFGKEMNLSRVQLHRKLKALIDISTGDYIRTLRLNKATGEYSVRFDGSDLPGGIYMIRLQVGDRVETEKMVLVR
jgi:hypothetical protein